MVRLTHLLSLIILILAALFAFGVFQSDGLHFFDYIRDSSHITTARALMNFQFFWSDIPSLGVLHDTQFYNGAVFPNTGYGVALLQLPFHILRNIGTESFVPASDHFIFLFYFLPVIIFLYQTVRQISLQSQSRLSDMQKEIFAASLTLFLCTYSLFQIAAQYFCVYEANTAYFLLAELTAGLACLRYRDQPLAKWLILAGACASLGALIRATGILMIPFWLAILSLDQNATKSAKVLARLRPLAIYGVALLPGLFYFCISNYVRSGHIFSFGFENVIPLIPELHTLRFDGNPCLDNWAQKIKFASTLFQNIFGLWNGRGHFYVTNLPTGLNNCGLIFDSADDTLMRAPFVPLMVSLPALLSTIYHTTAKRRFDILLAALGMAFVFGLYVYRQSGFGARYVVDFWPFIYFIFLASIATLLSWPAISKWIFPIVFCLLSSTIWTFYSYTSVIIKNRNCATTSVNELHVNPSIFHHEQRAYKLNRYRYRTGEEVNYAATLSSPPPVAARRTAADEGVINLVQDKAGWANSGNVEDITYFYIWLPEKSSTSYELVLTTSEIINKEIQVQINGTTHHVQAGGTRTVIPFHIEQEKLFSRMLAVTIRWAKSFGTQDVQLFSAELQ